MKNRDETLIRKILAETQTTNASAQSLDGCQTISNGAGGKVLRLKTPVGEQILKIWPTLGFSDFFKAEKTGLETLNEKSRFKIPKVFSCGKMEETHYLLMEYIPQGKPTAGFWEIFAENLAQMHRNTNSFFGFSMNNYIGSLPQFNKKENTADEFYIHQRLEPQFKLASENGFSFKNLERVFTNISAEIPGEKPALIHGDLWNGNYLVSENGFPVLIDPAICFAPREMDLPMMRFFGGFSEKFFSLYNEIFPLEPNFENRIKLWQLYYLLVHLNLFGGGYFSQVNEIVRDFS